MQRLSNRSVSAHSLNDSFCYKRNWQRAMKRWQLKVHCSTSELGFLTKYTISCIQHSDKCTNSLAIKGANWCTSYISWRKLLSRKRTKERLPEMDMKPAMLLLATLYFSAAAGMPYLILKNAKRLKWFHYAFFLPTLHLCLLQQLLKYTGSRGMLTLQVIQELPTHALHM